VKALGPVKVIRELPLKQMLYPPPPEQLAYVPILNVPALKLIGAEPWP
jgi:hypothetical protein